jgi:crossover junction endodeoxyribonuclease RuvC
VFDRVLGIDPGLSRCGYGLVERSGATSRALVHGVIRTHPETPVPERLALLQADVEALFAEHRPAVVAVERLFFQVNARTAMNVGQASGIVLAAAARHDVAVHQYTPNEVKQAVTGYGAAGKAQVRAMVTSLLKLAEPPRPFDACDALALALCHCTVGALRSRVDAALARGRAGGRAAGSRAVGAGAGSAGASRVGVRP